MRRFIAVAALLCGAGVLRADALRNAAEALERNDYVAAIPYLEAAIKEDPENVNARFNLAYACQATGAEEAAIGHYRRIAEEQPDLIPARHNLAAMLMQAGKFAEAATEFSAVAAARPDDPEPRSLAAEAWRMAGDWEAAREAYRRIFEQDGGSLETLLGLAEALVESGRVVEAVPYYLQAAAIDPEFNDVLPGIADRLEQAGARQDALELYRRYARERPEDAAVQEDIGIRLLEAGNPRAATAALERALAIKATATRHAALAEAYRMNGNTDAARTQLRLAAEADPQDAEGRVRYATSLLRQQDYDAAAQEYLAVARAEPQSQDAWNGLALAAFQLGDFPTALRALQHSEGLGTPPPASVYLKALALDRLQSYEQAQAAYRAFLALEPAMPDEVWKAEQRLRTIEKVLAKR